MIGSGVVVTEQPQRDPKLNLQEISYLVKDATHPSAVGSGLVQLNW